MGVLTCNRAQCRNTMCDRHSHEYGYICDECFQELVDFGIGASIEYFMKTEKPRYTNDWKESSLIFFNEIFPGKD